MQGGKIVFEDYQEERSADEAQALYSVTSGFWGVVAAAAVEDELMTFDEKAADTIVEWRGDPEKEKITLRQLLNGTSGLETQTDTFSSSGIANKFYYSVRIPSVVEAGSAFRYGPAPLYLFGEVLRRKLQHRPGSSKTDPLDYLKMRILDPIGAKISQWKRDESHQITMSTGAWMTARDLAKFGELIKNGGKWQGKSVVASETLAECFVGSVANPAYGLSFWLNRAPLKYLDGSEAALEERSITTINAPGTLRRPFYSGGPGDVFMAAGAGAQRLYVIPSKDIVIVRFGVKDRKFRDDRFLSILLENNAR